MPDTRPTFYGSFRESNAVALEILEPPIAAGVPIELDIYDGASPATMLATLEAARAKRWNPQLHDVGALSFLLNRHDPKATPAIIRRGNLAKIKVGGKYRGAAWLEDIDRTLVASGEKGAEDIKVGGRGELAYLERGTMWPTAYAGAQPVAGRYQLSGPLGDIARRILDELLSRPDGSPTPHLSIAWPIGSDSQGAAWDDSAELDPEVGANVLGVWQQLTALGLETEMTHELEVKTYRERGRHFEQPPTGNGTVTFLLGKHILGPWHERDRGGARKTRVIVKGADGTTITVTDTDAEADPHIGRRETSISVSGSSDPTTLQRAGEATLASLRAEGEQLELPVAHGSGPGEYEPFVHYRPGDFVAIEREDGTLETHRIVGLIFEELPGDYALTLQLNSIRVEALIRLKRMIDALGGGSTAAGSSGGSAVSGGSSGGSSGGGGAGDGKVAAAAGDTPAYLYDQLAAGNGIAKELTGGGAAQDVELRLELPGAIEDDVPAWDNAAGLWVPRPRVAGGGGGGAPSFLYSSKGAADTPDDEFSAAALNAKWTAVGGAAGVVALDEAAAVARYDLTTRPGWLLMQAGATAGQHVRLRQDYTLPDGASLVVPIATSVNIDAAPGVANDEQQQGISLNSDDTTPAGATNLTVYALEADAGVWDIQATSAGATGSVVGTSTILRPLGQIIFLRIARAGLTYRAYFSLDGTTWVHLAWTTWAAAHSNLWLFQSAVAAGSAPVPITAIPWVRQGTNGFDPWPWA